MKTIIIKFLGGLLLVLTAQQAKAQIHNPENAPYLGTWKYQSGPNIFRLIFWEEPDLTGSYCLMGHYQMSHLVGNVETIVYTSNPQNVPPDQKMSHALIGSVGVSGFSGTYREIHDGGSNLKGSFLIQPVFVCLGCVEKLHFKAKKMEGVRFGELGQPNDFVIPNDIDLVKE